MRDLFHLVRQYPLSTLCVALIWVLCFCTPPRTPLDGVPLIDKWTHIAMYGGTCAVAWVERLRHRQRPVSLSRMMMWAWLAPVLMSGLIELLQAYCTGGRRSGDWLDFIANAIGATLGFSLGLLLSRLRR